MINLAWYVILPQYFYLDSYTLRVFKHIKWKNKEKIKGALKTPTLLRACFLNLLMSESKILTTKLISYVWALVNSCIVNKPLPNGLLYFFFSSQIMFFKVQSFPPNLDCSINVQYLWEEANFWHTYSKRLAFFSYENTTMLVQCSPWSNLVSPGLHAIHIAYWQIPSWWKSP